MNTKLSPNNFGSISTKAVKRFCEATRKDKRMLDEAIRKINNDFCGFVEKTFMLTEKQSANLRNKLDPETTAVLAATCAMALRKGKEIEARFVVAEPGKIPNLKVTWRKCPPRPTAECCGVCVEWECD